MVRVPSSVDGGDGPGVAVRDAEVAVVAAGRDPVPDPEPFPGAGGDHVGVLDGPAATSRSRIAPLSAATCSRVSAITNMPVAPIGHDAGGGELGQRLGAFGLGGVEPDLTAA